MAYTKQTWTNDVSKVNETRMTHIEDGIYDNSTSIDTLNNNINPSGTATTTQTDFTEGQLTQKLGLKYIKMKGQTSQYTTTGKNKIWGRTDRSDMAIGTSNTSTGITYTRTASNTWVFNGKATADFTLVMVPTADLQEALTNGNTYTISGCPSRRKR